MTAACMRAALLLLLCPALAAAAASVQLSIINTVEGACTSGVCSLTTNAGGQTLTLTLLGTSDALNASSVWIGTASSPRLFACTPITPTSAATADCLVSAGTGLNLRVTLERYVAAPPDTLETIVADDTLSYPAPTITPNTLRRIGEPGSNVVTDQNINAPTVILFDGTNLFASDDVPISVTFGPSSQPFFFQCLSPVVTSTSIQCTLAPGGTGVNFFTVRVLQQTVTGTDRYVFPPKPVVTGVSGCVDASGGVTTQCPTNGGVTLTFTGQNFGETVQATVGGLACADLVRQSDTLLQCTLPAGTGLGRQVVVSAGLLASAPLARVSYAAPSIDQLECAACTNVSVTELLDCPRFGAVPLTVTGHNFGAASARVLVGGLECAPVTHDALTPHERLVCMLPTGNRRSRVVQILQLNGELSLSPALVSYSQCQPGSFETDLNCTLCSPGFFASQEAQQSCLQCDPGRYANASGFPSCPQCDAGYFRPFSSPPVNCTACPPGFVTAAPGLEFCTACDVGKYANESGMIACESCAPGYARGLADDASECPACRPGYFRDSAGAQDCVPCASGKAVNDSASQSCSECPPDSYAAGLGNYICSKCSSQSYQLYTQQAECRTCPKGEYLIKQKAQCATCPSGTFCAGFGFLPASTANYYTYVRPDGVMQSYSCLPNRCLDAAIYCPTTVSCCGPNRRPPEENILCDACIDDTYQWDDQCVYCNNSNTGLAVGLVTANWMFVLYTHFTSQRPHGSPKTLVYFMQMVSLTTNNNIRIGWALVLSLFELNIMERTNGNCLFPLDPLDKLVLRIFIPFLCFIQLWLTMIIAKVLMHFWRSCTGSRPAEEDLSLYAVQVAPPVNSGDGQSPQNPNWVAAPPKREQIPGVPAPRPRSYFRSMLSLVLFGYNAVVQVTLQFFMCINIEGNWVLASIPSVRCDSSNTKYQAYYSLFVLVGVFIVIGMPIGLLWFLVRHAKRGDLARPEFRSDWEPLFGPFTNQRYWWQSIIFLQRLLITLFSVVITNQSWRNSSIAMLHVCALLLQIVLVPFNLWLDNVFASCCHLILAFTNTMIIGIPDPYPDPERSLLTGIVNTYLLLIFIEICRFSCFDIPYRKYMWKRKKKREAEAAKIADMQQSSQQQFGGRDVQAAGDGAYSTGEETEMTALTSGHVAALPGQSAARKSFDEELQREGHESSHSGSRSGSEGRGTRKSVTADDEPVMSPRSLLVQSSEGSQAALLKDAEAVPSATPDPAAARPPEKLRVFRRDMSLRAIYNAYDHNNEGANQQQH